MIYFDVFAGIAQCAELCWQLRGQADNRQVPGAKLALQHNIGLGGAAVVALYKMGFSHPPTGFVISFNLFYYKTQVIIISLNGGL